MKRLVLVLVCLLVVVIVAIAALPRILDVNRYHDRIQAELQTRLGRQVQLGQMNLGVLPPTFKVQNAVIAEDPKFNSGMPFAQTAELDIRVKLMPLLHKQVQVESLEMKHPQVELIRGADGGWNFSGIGTHAQQQSKEQQQAGQNQPLQLARFQIIDGAVAITDQQKNQPRKQYDHINLLLKDYAPGKPFDVAVSASLPGAGNQVVKLDGHGGPIEDATLVSTPFQGTLQLNQVALSNAQQYLQSKALSGIEALISGNLKFNNDAGKLFTTGTVRMDNVVAHGKPLGYPIELDYNASDDIRADVVTISNTKLKLGSAPFVISGTINGKSSPALADLKLNAQNAPVGELVELAEVAGASLSPGMHPSGALGADLTARGPLSGPAVAGVLHLTQLKVNGVTASSLQLNLNLAPPGPELVRTLNGRVTVNMSDGQLTGVDMSQKLGEIGKFTNAGTVANGATHVSSLTGDFDLKNGVATTNDLKALTDAGTMAATGTISLVDRGLDLRATAVLSKTSSQQVGGNGIGGLMTTAMENKNGELVIPVLITGTIQSPKVSPDLNQMAKMRMTNMIPSFSNPGQLVHGGAGGLLNSVTGSSPGAAAGNQQQNGNTLQNEVGGLGGLFGGKKKQ